MVTFSLLEFNHNQAPDPADREAMLEWADEIVQYLRGGAANDLPYGVFRKFIRKQSDPCPIEHLKRTKSEAMARIRSYNERRASDD